MFSHVQLFVTPRTVACQASLSMEFSRQEYWSGLPFPSPEELPNSGIESWSPASQADSLLLELQRRLQEVTAAAAAAKSHQSCPTLCDPMNCSLPSSSVHGILQARILEWIAIPFSRGTSQPRMEPWSPALQADSLPFELQGSLQTVGS